MKLYLDTSGENSQIALYDSRGKLIGQRTASLKLNQSERILSIIDGLLKDKELKRSDLRLIEINCGPGSYTGLRIGITTANFMAFALNVPVVCLGDTEQKGFFGGPVKPRYNKEPFISKEKSRLK